jgi:hypothetical protein
MVVVILDIGSNLDVTVISSSDSQCGHLNGRGEYYLLVLTAVGRDSSVGTATRYELDGPGIESRLGGEIFSTRPDRPWCLPSLLYNGYRVSFPGVKRLGRGVDHPPHLAPRLKKE